MKIGGHDFHVFATVGGVGNEGDVAAGARGDSQHVTEEEEVPPDCDMCEVEEGGAVQVATKWCVECTVLYCDQCFAQCHRMKGPFAAHTIKVGWLVESLLLCSHTQKHFRFE